MPFHITVKVFGASGEQVAVLYVGGISEMPGSPKLLGSLVQSGYQGVDIAFAGLLKDGSSLLSWKGLNDSGGSVVGGVYYIHVESVDQFGTVSSYNLGVNVIEPVGQNTISIFNSAGELVYQESYQSLTGTVTDLTLQSQAFAPAFDSPGNPLNKVEGEIRSNTGVVSPWTWDGRNSQGLLVKPGVYSIQLSSAVAGGAPAKLTRQIQVLAAPDEMDAGAILLYSPATASSLAAHGGMLLRFNSAAVLGNARARLYNLAGELVGQADAGAASGQLRIGMDRHAAGIYIVIFEYTTPSRVKKRSLLKAAVLK
jgi:hypothetical protein